MENLIFLGVPILKHITVTILAKWQTLGLGQELSDLGLQCLLTYFCCIYSNIMALCFSIIAFLPFKLVMVIVQLQMHLSNKFSK